MPYDSIISRTDAASTIPEEVVADVIKAATAQSAALGEVESPVTERTRRCLPSRLLRST